MASLRNDRRRTRHSGGNNAIGGVALRKTSAPYQKRSIAPSRSSPIQRSTSEQLRQECDMMPVPVARKALIRIGEPLSAQKLRHPGIAAQQLVAARKAMVRQKITAIGFDRAVDESLQGEPGAVHAGSVMIHMQVEDDADIVPLGPSEKCILVLLDQPDGAVDEVDRMAKKILANRRHELG